MINLEKLTAARRPPPPEVEVLEETAILPGMLAESAPEPAPSPPPPAPPPRPAPTAALSLEGVTEKDVDRMLRDAQQQLYEAARNDFNTFAELVMTDDETGEPIKQAPIHKRWVELCEQYDRLLIWSHINSGKTTQLSILRSVWELGRDHTLRIVILSNTSSIATKIVKAIMNLIEHNDAVKAIFPTLKKNEAGPWTTTELTVERPTFAKDPSVRAVGVSGSLTSGRVDRLIVDDILDPENTSTDAQRNKVEAWYKAVAVGRQTRRMRVIVVGTAYHPKDLLHTLAAQKSWKAVRFPVINSKGRVAWPELWPPERIERLREELGPAEFARQLSCLARDDDAARFKKEWINAALRRGEGLTLVHSLPEVPDGCATYTGVDLAVGMKKRNDRTSFFTFLEDKKGHRTVLNIESGQFTGPQIVEMIVDHHHRYHSLIAVENNAAQDFILQFTRKDFNVPVIPHTTGKLKKDPRLGVEGLAVELFNGKWTIPCIGSKGEPEVEAWITEMLFYNPAAHTGDRLMSNYFAREAARKMGNRMMPTATMRVIGGDRPNQSIYR